MLGWVPTRAGWPFAAPTLSACYEGAVTQRVALGLRAAAKAASHDFALEVAVGRGDHANIDRHVSVAADPLDLTPFERAQDRRKNGRTAWALKGGSGGCSAGVLPRGPAP